MKNQKKNLGTHTQRVAERGLGVEVHGEVHEVVDGESHFPVLVHDPVPSEIVGLVPFRS